MKKTLTTLIVLSIILYLTKINDAIEGDSFEDDATTTSSPPPQVAQGDSFEDDATTTSSPPPQVAQGDSLFQGKCLLSNGYLISPGGAYKLSLSPNGNLIQQVILFYFIQNII